jgi:hypothetical protein
MKAGDTVDIDCTFDNTTPNRVHFGNSSRDEMCFVGLYRYPAAGKSFVCVQ